MRYRVVVSRVQVAERNIRAMNEEEAAKRIQKELEAPYAFFGGWRTINTEVDITEAAAPLVTPAVIGEGSQLLAIKDAAKYLGISYSALYELVNTAEIPHVAVGRRKYISRDALKSFIESHTRLGYHDREF